MVKNFFFSIVVREKIVHANSGSRKKGFDEASLPSSFTSLFFHLKSNEEKYEKITIFNVHIYSFTANKWK